MTERIGTIKSFIEGPRWANLSGFLKNQCFLLDLDLQMEVDKGFIRETVRFTIEGPESKLIQMKEMLESSVEDYNK